ncbi:GNAT family N-acetyltransferase [Nocardioides sp. LHG3406-4]|uniref:GNAT family N-acetyltransferase n=1 Tax=Nocardioides sp. LHG3406-4 TaxID=2804575 RepID=UPI003CF7C7DB
MYDVRPARADDLPSLAAIENAGLALFEEALGDLTGDVLASPAPSGAERASQPGFLLVAGDPPVGFAHVLHIEGGAHLEQVSVLPAAGRRGVGAALVRAAMAEAGRRGLAEITLCTYADLPWNGPFYSRLGFTEVEPTGHLRLLRDRERELGLDRHGRRAAMRAPVAVLQDAGRADPPVE